MIRLQDKQLVRFAAFLLVLSCSPAFAAEYIESTIESDIVPGPVEFAVLLPDGCNNLDLDLLSPSPRKAQMAVRAYEVTQLDQKRHSRRRPSSESRGRRNGK